MGVFLLKPITIKEIARMANVSCATVSRTLNGGPGVSQELRGRIFQLCRQHGYRKNLVARRLSASHSGLIGCILSDMNNPFLRNLRWRWKKQRIVWVCRSCSARVR